MFSESPGRFDSGNGGDSKEGRMDEREERMEASDRASRYYEINGIDEPPHDSEEWREMVTIKLEKLQRGD